MPKLEKGSDAAKAWAAKMKKAREAKKGIKGGMMDEGSSDEELAGLTANMSMQDKSRPSGPVNLPKPVLKKRTTSPVQAESKTTGKRQAETQMKKEQGKGMKKKISKNIMMGGYLQPGEVPSSAGIDPTDDVPEYIQEPDGQDVSIDGEGMCKCSKCEMCGGKIKMPGMKGLTRGLAKAGEALNPMSYALKNKGSRDLMIQSGKFTNDTALPAVVSAGLPMYYGAAGTAGMMLGGPAGSMAATKGAEMLYNEMVGKPGYDPRARQKSKTLGVVSGEVGKMGASNLKAGASGKGMSGGSLSPLEQSAVLLGIPVSLAAIYYSSGRLQELIDYVRGRNAVAPEQQEEFKEAMGDIEMGTGMRKKKAKKAKLIIM
jgi:hypothetical protein